MGANYKSAPMEIREKLYIPDDKLCLSLPECRQRFNFTELVALSTCNRFELLGVILGVDELDLTPLEPCDRPLDPVRMMGLLLR